VNLFVNQTITIYQLKVQGIQNSSVMQIGSAGMIRPVSNLYNTGGYTGSAPPLASLPTVELPAPS
jgi:spore germination protein PB